MSDKRFVNKDGDVFDEEGNLIMYGPGFNAIMADLIAPPPVSTFRKVMTRILLILTLIGAILGAMFLADPPTAKADGVTYLNALGARGLMVWDMQLALKQGYAVCSELDYTTGDKVVNMIVNMGSYDRNEAQIIVFSAVEELCPRHDHRWYS